MVPYHLRPAPEGAARPDPQAPSPVLTALALFLGVAAIIAGSGQACGLPAGAQRIPVPIQDGPALGRDNPRLAEMQTAASVQADAEPVTYTPRVHLANGKAFRHTALRAALNQGWHPLPQQPGYTRPPDTFVVPQQDLPKLAALENDPIGQITTLAEGPARSPSAGPLVTVRIQVNTYITPSGASKATIAAGTVLTVAALLSSWTLSTTPNRERRT